MTDTEWLCLQLVGRIGKRAELLAERDYRAASSLPGSLPYNELQAYYQKRKAVYRKALMEKSSEVMREVLSNMGDAQ